MFTAGIITLQLTCDLRNSYKNGHCANSNKPQRILGSFMWKRFSQARDWGMVPAKVIWVSSNSDTVLLPVSQQEKTQPVSLSLPLLLTPLLCVAICFSLSAFLLFILLPHPKWQLHKNQTERWCLRADGALEKCRREREKKNPVK